MYEYLIMICLSCVGLVKRRDGGSFSAGLRDDVIESFAATVL